ncbi:MAG TPA: choice-of-anchor tandem repeat GloVer-containing protein [Candidatus Saccharimonadales bacterium]|nr:choice-of-anchor tandem repeat GloVer-containing protein [Candidatus Saccharimonadales bacterium]
MTHYTSFIYNGSFYTTFGPPFATYSVARGISGSNIVGIYGDSSGGVHGYLFDGTQYTTLDYGSYNGLAGTSALGISSNGTIVGGYTVPSGPYQGDGFVFLYQNGVYTPLTALNNLGSLSDDIGYLAPVGISENYVATYAGTYDNGSQFLLYNISNSTVTVVPPASGMSYSVPYGAGGNFVVGQSYNPSGSGSYPGFLYNISGHYFLSMIDPAAPLAEPDDYYGTYCSGVTSSGVVLGWYYDAGPGIYRSFVATPPTVAFTATPTNGAQPLTVQFSPASTDSANNTLTNWLWNFGDGSTNATSTSQNPSHTYTTNGAFTVTLMAFDSQGAPANGVGNSTIVVTGNSAQFTASTTNGIMPLLVQFSGPSQDSAGNVITSWNWDFGNNSTSTFQQPETTYVSTKSKTFSPKLTVTNSLGAAIVATGPPQISALYPLVAFTANPASGLVPMTVQFTTPSADTLLVPITNWAWTFGDGAKSTNQNPSHIYTNAGIFGVTLSVSNSNGTQVAGIGPKISTGCAEVYTFATEGTGYSSVNYALTNNDGVHPYAGLTLSGSNFYGVMSGGGNNGSGAIFSLTTNGSGFTNLYEFSAQAVGSSTNGDGAAPKAQLALYGDMLYGSASSGGAMNGGTVFSLNTDGSGFSNLCNLSSVGGGGYLPNGVVMYGSTLYGTAEYGGSNSSGTIFEIGPGGFAPIHEFSATQINLSTYAETNGDGAYPAGTLIVAGSNPVTLYGTASQGGIGGGGTVFALTTNGLSFTVLHSFTNVDGQSPQGALVLSGNTLFGTTRNGGSGNNGTVFKVNTNGSGFATIYNFSAGEYNPATLAFGNSDGANPQAGLLLSGSMLYGTAESGGPNGSGAIFQVDTNNGANFTTLYSFSAVTDNPEISAFTNLDGANPYSTLALAGDTLYATTYGGGSAGEGSVFELSLAMAAPPLDIQASGATAVISWPSFEIRLVLEQCTSLAAGDWITNNSTVSDNGTAKSVTISLSPTVNLFFRLKQ